jgi:hypothetical protein
MALKRHRPLKQEVRPMISPTSCFAQVLSLIDRHEFEGIVRRRRAEHAAKGFTCWEQFVAMLFCQVGAAHSLREICGGLATATGKLSHLGLSEAPGRSTLAYANEHRPWELYQDVFGSLLGRCRELAARNGRKFRFKNPLVSLDATTIDLCLSMYDWAKFRRTKGAVKLHLMLDHQGCLPSWGLVTEGAVNEVKVAQNLSFLPGMIVVVDRGYMDFVMFHRWTALGVWFVTRAKDNLVYRVIERREVPGSGSILKDQFIRLTGLQTGDDYPELLRRVVVWDEEGKRELVFLTNRMDFAASTIAAIYKERWQIELFFKALKQNLKVKTFVGTSENAVKAQIWTALIAILLLKFLQLKSTFAWSLSNLSAMLRFNLLTYRDLWAWLDAPFLVPLLEPGAEQLILEGV